MSKYKDPADFYVHAWQAVEVINPETPGQYLVMMDGAKGLVNATRHPEFSDGYVYFEFADGSFYFFDEMAPVRLRGNVKEPTPQEESNPDGNQTPAPTV